MRASAYRAISAIGGSFNRRASVGTEASVPIRLSCRHTNSLPAAEVLEWYRVRWQIELVFKRMKSLAALGQLPKHDDRSSRAWLYGKLLVALLGQELMRLGRDISPWGYRQPEAWKWQRVAGL